MHVHGAAASSAAASHHHATTTSVINISHSPQPCGHDHNGVVAVTASSDAAHTRPLMTPSAAVLPESLAGTSFWTSFGDLQISSSPPGWSDRGYVSPLRV
jgi:hypothetical protein